MKHSRMSCKVENYSYATGADNKKKGRSQFDLCELFAPGIGLYRYR